MASEPPSAGTRLTGWLGRFTAHGDPLVVAGNRLALIVASNQPFYPVYVGLIAGAEAAWRSAIVLVAVPFFVAVPLLGRRAPVLGRALLLGRRAPVLGRALLPITGIANTLISVRALGSDVGLDVLLVPCAAIAALLFRARERVAMLGVVGLAALAWLLADMAPAGIVNAEAAAGLRRMNAISAIALCGLLGWLVPRR